MYAPVEKRGKSRYRRQSIQALVVMMLVALLFLPSPSFSPRAFAGECPAGGAHAYTVSIITPATDDSDGAREYRCSKCGYSYQESIPATGHIWGPWVVDVEPTCTSEGHEYRICTRYPDSPHREERVIAALSADGRHSYDLVDEVAATCTEPGRKVYKCGVCGASYTETIPASGHDWEEWVTDRQPTSTEEGSRYRACRNGTTHIESETIPATGVVLLDDAACDGSDTVLWVTLGIDLLTIIVFLIAATPLIYQVRWIRSRRRLALQRGRGRRPSDV